MSDSGLRLRDRLALALQNRLSFACAPLVLSLLPLLLRGRYRWRVVGHRRLRGQLRAELGAASGPLMICANHLTLVDSVLILWALAPAWWYLLNFRFVPWNVPERKNFAHTMLARVGAYLAKCLPVTRGGDRRQVTAVVSKLRYLLCRGHAVLLFPEGGRSRTGRIATTNPALATGRVVKDVPGARVLCVYLRGERQAQFSRLPARGERFHCAISWLEPVSSHHGLRGSVEISGQILARLEEMEQEYFDGR